MKISPREKRNDETHNKHSLPFRRTERRVPLAHSTNIDTLTRSGGVARWRYSADGGDAVADSACAQWSVTSARLASHLFQSILRICQHLLPRLQSASPQYRPFANALLFRPTFPRIPNKVWSVKHTWKGSRGMKGGESVSKGEGRKLYTS
jgi:hypothetical protein